jgi:hypothetical protein
MYDVIMKAMKGDTEAQQQLYVWAYLWPKLEEAFAPPAEAFKGEKLWLNPMTRGDYELANILALVSLGPQPEPPDLPVSAMKQFHERLVAVTDRIAAEIAALEADKRKA